ncbi:hypothetical protein [Konateibacter massiliensis]|uniref:hypothetical protein n=1 Tax=Konateibacter massiliensis TaxID=2002841 RepID=UPI000C1475D7|nr:hypothetical protein [Konateibacter massiliensis]
MLLFIQCLILCIIFSLAILPAQYRNPLSQFASYPTAIKMRVYELPQYKDYINSVEHNQWKRKILGAFLISMLFAALAYFSGKRTFVAAFFHVFLLFSSVNLYDLIVCDLIIFCHSKKLMLPGTEDMTEEYKSPKHHIVGALKGCAIGAFVSLVSASLVLVLNYITE